MTVGDPPVAPMNSAFLQVYLFDCIPYYPMGSTQRFLVAARDPQGLRIAAAQSR
ncbi:MAG: hypothetical protein ACKODG_13110 [Betaproteobacteria bacterium]